MARPTLSYIASIQWGSTIDWEFEFGQEFAPPAPFNKKVPALSVEFPHASIQEKDIPLGNRTAMIPLEAGAVQMTVVFVDDTNDTMLTYFESWADSLSSGGTATLDEAKRLAVFYKTNRAGDIGKNPIYLVELYPSGDINSSVGESAEVRNISVTFTLVSKTIR